MDGDLKRFSNPCQPAVDGRDRAVPGCVLEAKMVFCRCRVGPGNRICNPLPSGAGIDNESDQVSQEYPVDALALRGDEGRGTLR